MVLLCLRDLMFNRFDTIAECDRHAHRQTDTRRRRIAMLASRSKKTLITLVVAGIVVLRQFRTTSNTPFTITN